MQKRHTILAAILILVIMGCAIAALLVWKQQNRAAQIAANVANVPAIPDLSRWPEGLSREIRDATAKARSGSDSIGSLSHLAYLYLGNSYVVQAKQPLAALCRLEPSNAQWRYLMADAHARLGETNAAEADFQETTKLDPKYARAWIRLGLLRTQRGAGAEAHECYMTAAAINTNDLMSVYLLMEFEARNGGGVDLRQRAAEFVHAHPDFRQPHGMLGELDATAGDEADAAKERRAASAAPRMLPDEDPWVDHLAQFCYDTEHLRTLSLNAFSQGRLNDAEKILKWAIQVAPADALNWDALCSVYEKMGRSDDALRTLQEAVVKSPDAPNLRVQLSRMFSSMHRPDDAVAAIQSAVQRWPANAELHAAFGFALSNVGKNDQAVKELQEAIRLDSTQVEVRYNLAVGLLALGQHDEAKAAAQKALEMRPDYPDAISFLSVLALDDNDLATAETIVSKLYSLQPDDPKAQSIFCRLQLLKGAAAEKAGNPAEADKLYRSGLAVGPTNWRLLRADGLLCLRPGHFPEAIENFRGYVQAKPEETEAYFMLGAALSKAGQGDEARKVLQQGLSLEQKKGGNSKRIEAFKHALQQL